MKRSIQLLAIVSVLTVLWALAGCNNNDSEPQESAAASGVSAQSVTESADPIVGQWQSEELPDYVYTFRADGTGQYDMSGNILDLTYTTEEGKITISFLVEGYTPVTLNYELKDEKLNIRDSFGKDTFYVRVEN